MSIDYEWRGALGNAEINKLHAEGFGHRPRDDDWVAQLDGHSLGWVTAREAGELIGFVNVAWDGAAHAFVLDTLVANRARRRAIGTKLVAIAATGARTAGCEWLHVDFDEELTEFYLGACGFDSTPAGVIPLSAEESAGPAR